MFEKGQLVVCVMTIVPETEGYYGCDYAHGTPLQPVWVGEKYVVRSIYHPKPRDPGPGLRFVGIINPMHKSGVEYCYDARCFRPIEDSLDRDKYRDEQVFGTAERIASDLRRFLRLTGV